MKNNNEQFTKIPHILMSSKLLTDQDKLTLAVIYSFIENNKQCFIGNDRLADMLGISRKAASKRILKLEDLGCIKIDYVYKEGSTHIEKRYITFISFNPTCVSHKEISVSCQEIDVSHEETGVSLQTTGVSPQETEVSPKGGGIIQPSLLDNLKDKLLNKVSNNVSNKEILKQSLNKLKLPEEIVEFFFLYMDGATTKEQRNKLLEFKTQIQKVPALNEVIKNLY